MCRQTDKQDGEAQPPHLGGITSFGPSRSLIAALSSLSWQAWPSDRDAVHDLVGPQTLSPHHLFPPQVGQARLCSNNIPPGTHGMLIVGLRTRNPHLNSETHRQISVPATPRKLASLHAPTLRRLVPCSAAEEATQQFCTTRYRRSFPTETSGGTRGSEGNQRARVDHLADHHARTRKKTAAKETDTHAREEYRKANQCRVNASPCRQVRPTNVHLRPPPSSHDVCAVRQPLAVVPTLRIPTQGCPWPGHSTPPSCGPPGQHSTVHNIRLSQGCPGCPTVCVFRVSVYTVHRMDTGQGIDSRAQLSPTALLSSRWHTEDSNPTQGVGPRGPTAPTKMTSVMATRAKNRASLALPLPCNAVDEASKLSPMTTAVVLPISCYSPSTPPIRSGPSLDRRLRSSSLAPVPR